MKIKYTSQLGINLDQMQSDKYQADFDVNKNIIRLTNQIWKLIPMRENEEDWKKQLKIVLIDIAGLQEIFNNDSFLELLIKLEGMAAIETEFDEFRSTVFKCITLLKEAKDNEGR